MAQSENRRKLTNMLIDPRLQMFLFSPYLVTVAAFAVTNVLIVRFVIATFGRFAQDAAVTIDLSEVYVTLSLYSALGLIVAGVIGFGLSLVVSHHLLGPLFNIQRHVRRLRAGEYEHVLTLRRGDRLGELADDLNAITTRLNAPAGTPSPKA